jgi:hypothetical protein
MTPQPLVVTPAFLKQIQTALLSLQDQVEAQLQGGATYTDDSGNTQDVPVVDSSLSVDAGGPSGSTGSFGAATGLNSKLSAVSGTVQQQLLNWQKWCSDMISDISTTLSNFSTINDFNTQSVQQLLNEFPLTTTDMSSTGNLGSAG